MLFFKKGNVFIAIIIVQTQFVFPVDDRKPEFD